MHFSCPTEVRVSRHYYLSLFCLRLGNRRQAEANLLQETPIGDFVKRFSKAVRSYVLSTNVLEQELSVVNLILNIIVVNINVFSALVVTLTCNKLKGGLVVAVELN
jgi:hypothetical protein